MAVVNTDLGFKKPDNTEYFNQQDHANFNTQLTSDFISDLNAPLTPVSIVDQRVRIAPKSISRALVIHLTTEVSGGAISINKGEGNKPLLDNEDKAVEKLPIGFIQIYEKEDGTAFIYALKGGAEIGFEDPVITITDKLAGETIPANNIVSLIDDELFTFEEVVKSYKVTRLDSVDIGVDRNDYETSNPTGDTDWVTMGFVNTKDPNIVIVVYKKSSESSTRLPYAKALRVENDGTFTWGSEKVINTDGINSDAFTTETMSNYLMGALYLSYCQRSVVYYDRNSSKKLNAVVMDVDVNTLEITVERWQEQFTRDNYFYPSPYLGINNIDEICWVYRTYYDVYGFKNYYNAVTKTFESATSHTRLNLGTMYKSNFSTPDLRYSSYQDIPNRIDSNKLHFGLLNNESSYYPYFSCFEFPQTTGAAPVAPSGGYNGWHSEDLRCMVLLRKTTYQYKCIMTDRSYYNYQAGLASTSSPSVATTFGTFEGGFGPASYERQGHRQMGAMIQPTDNMILWFNNNFQNNNMFKVSVIKNVDDNNCEMPVALAIPELTTWQTYVQTVFNMPPVKVNDYYVCPLWYPRTISDTTKQTVKDSIVAIPYDTTTFYPLGIKNTVKGELLGIINNNPNVGELGSVQISGEFSVSVQAGQYLFIQQDGTLSVNRTAYPFAIGTESNKARILSRIERGY